MMESSSTVSRSPTWISSGGKPLRLACSREPIVQCRWETMLRRKAVVDGEHAAAARARDLRIQVPVRGDRTDAKAAAMEIENGLVLRRVRRRYPFAIDAAAGDGLACHGCG